MDNPLEQQNQFNEDLLSEEEKIELLHQKVKAFLPAELISHFTPEVLDEWIDITDIENPKNGAYPERKKDWPEDVSQEQMKAVLATVNVRPLPKERDLKLPLITEQDLIHSFGERNASKVGSTLERLLNFLNFEAIVDDFGDGKLAHRARRSWRPIMAHFYGEVFKEVYEDSNQLRRQVLQWVPVSAQLLARNARSGENMDLARKLYQIDEETGIIVMQPGPSRPSRYDLFTFAKKLETVRFFEDKAVETLMLLTDSEKPQTSLMRVT